MSAVRTIVVTGAASGIGAALTRILTERGERVITADLHDADVIADLSTPDGRTALVEGVRDRSDGHIDAIVANAGLITPTPKTVSVNCFGAVATLEGLRPLLAGSPTPRASVAASIASLNPYDQELLDLIMTGDEPGALARAEVLAANPDPAQWRQIYTTSKRAVAMWVRRHAVTDEWAGAGIALNAVAPGLVATPMTAPQLEDPEQVADVLNRMPMPLNGVAQPETPAYLHAFLVSAENTHMCGQVVFVDGGSDVLMRGDSTW